MRNISNDVVLKQVGRLFKAFPVGMASNIFIVCMRGLASFLPQIFISQIVAGISSYSGDGHPFRLVQTPFLYLLAFTLALTASFRLWHYLYHYKTVPQILEKIKSHAVKLILEKAPAFFHQYPSGYISTRINQYTSGTEHFLDKLFSGALPNLLDIVVPVAFLATISPKIALYSCGSLVIMAGGLYVCMGKLAKYGYEYHERASRADGSVVDVMTNIWTLKFFSAKQREYKRLRAIVKRMTDFRQKIAFVWLVMFFVSNDIFGLLVFGLSSFLAFQELAAGTMSVANFIFVILQAIRIANQVWQVLFSVPDLLHHYQEARYAIEFVNEDMHMPEKHNAPELALTAGEITFDSVRFHYQDKGLLFDDLNVLIPDGQHVGLVGESGSGKTSFTNLILRLYDVDSGAIRIDGQDLRDVRVDSIYRNIVIISQNPMLLDLSIADNIRYGHFDASDEDIVAAAQKAHIHEFIDTLPQGYNTSATTLSGGQKQRVSIARAMLKIQAHNPKIVIIDEGTSQIDSVTEAMIQSSFEEVIKGRTAIIIAHRLSTIRNMDRLMVFSKGQIIEDGSPAELEALNGHYARLKKTQGMIGVPEA